MRAMEEAEKKIELMILKILKIILYFNCIEEDETEVGDFFLQFDKCNRILFLV